MAEGKDMDAVALGDSNAVYEKGPNTPSGAEIVQTAGATAEDKIVKVDNELAIPLDDPDHPDFNASPISLGQLFSYADKTDYILMVVGALLSIVNGLVQPALILVFGDTVDAFNTAENRTDEVWDKVKWMLILSGVAFIAGYGQVVMWMITAERQSKRIREKYVEAIMRQDIGWFDFRKSGDLISSVTEKTAAIQEGMGRKWGDALQFGSMFIGGYALGFWKGWKLTLVLCAALPPLALTGFFLMKTISGAASAQQASYARAGGVASEVVSSIRTVVAFGGQKREVRRYFNALQGAEQAGIKKAFQVGLASGLVFFTAFGSYALGLWFGSKMIVDDRENRPELCAVEGVVNPDCMTGGKVLTVFFSVIIGSMAVGQASPSVTAVATARAVAGQVFYVINRASKIDPLSKQGKILESVKGSLLFKNIRFRYPTRPSVEVAKGYSFAVEPGQTVALVGQSGSGKSTAVALLERFYDPEEGAILLDGHDLRELNLRWLRSQIGLVGQEPVLFSGTIAENIGHGKPGSTREEIEEAAKMANAYDFIVTFPQGFDTEVGEKGVQLSGGQKQRVAIARAIIKDPSILLLDEATSALDNESERIVQASLDRLLKLKQRTTIVIAHRLTTIRDAHNIIVFEQGNLMEQGNHAELMAKNGIYKKLVTRQIEEATEEEDVSRITASFQEEEIEATRKATFKSQVSLRSDKRHSSFADGAITMAEAVDVDMEGKNAKLEEEQAKVPLSRIWKLNLPELPQMLFGTVGALLNGAVFPVWGLLVAKMIGVFFRTDNDDISNGARDYAIAFIAVGIAALIGNVAQFYFFGIAGEKLTRRVRELVFKAVLRQEISYFDREENSSGNVCSRLSEDATLIQSQTGETLARNMANIMTLAVGLSLAFSQCWQITLVMLAIFPLLAFAGWVQMAVFSGTFGGETARVGGGIVAEGVNNIRTVSSFVLQEVIIQRFTVVLESQKKSATRGAQIAALGFGASQFIMFAAYALVFWYGSKLIEKGVTGFEGMFVPIMVIMLSAMGFGNAAQNMTDATRARRAINNVFNLIDRAPTIDSESESGVFPTEFKGRLEFTGVHFRYPSRPDVPVCRGYNFSVNSGETIALVGASGSGKSTAVNLLERFYDVDLGSILVDHVDLRDLNVQWLRQQIGLVGQEPVLFSGTIAENIAYGKPDATREEIIEAAKQSNAHIFISSFPDGYDTEVGEKGVQMSGGQKQRIAIARAIIRNPAILLLDEATSALDTESERVVQQALDQLMAQSKRTTIVIAHRLSTIRDADKILLIEKGVIVEEGSHDELMAKKGKYAKLLATKMRS